MLLALGLQRARQSLARKNFTLCWLACATMRLEGLHVKWMVRSTPCTLSQAGADDPLSHWLDMCSRFGEG